MKAYFAPIWVSIKKNREWYLFILPAVVFYILFKYSPMYFIQIAFKSFRVTRPLDQCQWVGLKYFSLLFSSPDFWSALKNTISISLQKLVFGFPLPIILALLLNEVGNLAAKRTYQTIVYLPHFISWAIIGSIIYSFTAVPDGMFNKIIALFGMKSIVFLGQVNLFQPILVLSDIWKSTGWGMILYIAAMTRISPDLYEAARIDGATRMQQILHITLPGIKDIVVITLILRLGYIMNAGFEQVLILQNPMVLSVGDTLDTFVYRNGLLNAQYSYAAAAGLFQGIINAVMVLVADSISKKFGEEGIF